ncbi:unnamed protein product, partial [Meganyctiphanes norvegica]
TVILSVSFSTTAMKKLLQSALLVAAVAGSLAQIYCYDCSSDESFDDYDPNCGNNNYQGRVDFCPDCDCCRTEVNDDGSVYRFSDVGNTDGTCWKGKDFVACWCTDDYCDTGLCEHCDVEEPVVTYDNSTNIVILISQENYLN